MNAQALAQEAASSDPLLQPLYFLLMRYARSPSPVIAENIANCVDGLLNDHNFRVPPGERCTYLRMRRYWRLIASLG